MVKSFNLVLGSNAMSIDSDVYYMIVYPCGDRSRLTVATVQWFDENDYDLASHQKFADEAGAVEYARELSAKHSIRFEYSKKSGAILD